MNDEEEYLMKKKYVTYDIEADAFNELDMKDWIEVTEEYEEAFVEKASSKPFSYSKMLESVMDHLEKTGGVEFAVLKDHELGRWWAGKVKERERAKKLKDAKEKLYSTMSKEELKILGIKI